MRRTIPAVTTPGRWRRRRTARIGLAAALVVAAPFADRADTPPADQAPAAASAADDSDPAASEGAGDTVPRGPVRVVPVPLADPAVADLLRPGDLVDLVATVDLTPERAHGHAPGHAPALVAHAVRVRDAPAPAGRSGGRTLLVEVPEADAAHLAATAAGTPLAVVVHG